MDEMLTRANNGLVANFVTVEQFLQGKHVSLLEIRRLELEMQTGGDHDTPYRFELPDNMPQVLAWIRLLAKVHRGELKP